MSNFISCLEYPDPINLDRVSEISYSNDMGGNGYIVTFTYCGRIGVGYDLTRWYFNDKSRYDIIVEGLTNNYVKVL